MAKYYDRIPGWYGDPDERGALRYWDGDDWTDDVMDRPTEGLYPRAEPVTTWTIARGVAIGIVLAVAALVVLAKLTG